MKRRKESGRPGRSRRPSRPATDEVSDRARRPITSGGTPALLVFLFALLLRLLALAELHDLPLMRSPQLDSLEYFAWARVLATGDFIWPASPPHGPGYPFFLALLLAIFNQSLTAVRVVQAVMGALTCVLVFDIARRRFGLGAGLAAGLLLAAYGPMILLDLSILAESLMIFLIVSAAALLLDRLSIGRVMAAGILIGLAATVRPTALVVLAAGVIIVARWRPSAVLILIVAAVIPIAPVTAMNWKKSKAFIPVQAHGGLNLYYGNSPSRTGIADSRVGGPWTSLANEAKRRGLDGAEADRYFLRKAFAEIRDAPAAYARLLAKKTAWLVSNTEIRESHSYYFFREQSRVLRVALPFAVIFALAVAGIVVSIRRRDANFDLLLLIVLLSLTFVGLLVGSRYRAPVVPFLSIFAGVGLTTMIASMRERRYRDLAPISAIAAAAFAISLIPRHRPSYEFAEEWEFTGRSLLREDRFDEASDAFERAIALDSHHALAWLGQASVAASKGNFTVAEQDARKAVAYDPQNDRAHYLLGVFLERRGSTADAIREYQAAMAIEPYNLVAAKRLGETLVSSGRIAEAASVYEQILEPIEREELLLMPDEQAALQMRVAQIQGALRRPEKGIARAQAATRLDPSNGDAWLLLGMLAVDAGKPDVARDACEHAQAIAGSTPQVSRLRALIGDERAAQ